MLTAVKIANRALQRVGAKRITSLTENSKNASEVNACYDMLRLAELRRNVWRFAIRRTALRAIDVNTISFIPPDWAVDTAFNGYDIALYNGVVYIASNATTGEQPDISAVWSRYVGPATASLWATGTSYFSGELVYVDTTMWMSLQNANTQNPAIADWDVDTAYVVGDQVQEDFTVYTALTDNTGNDPSGDLVNWTSNGDVLWHELTGVEEFDVIQFLYPIGTGPQSQDSTRNVFALPVGYLREASQNPKAGSVSFLGAPSGIAYNDWVLESNYLITSSPGPIVFRFGADVEDPNLFDPMFGEGLASRIAFEVCEPLTQSTGKLQAIGSEYKQFMGDARTVNGIEEGPDEPPEDDYLMARI